MLILKAYINDKEIDEVHVWNTSLNVDLDSNTWEYRILKPSGFERVPIFHQRDLGWKPLAAQVLRVLSGEDLYPGDENEQEN